MVAPFATLRERGLRAIEPPTSCWQNLRAAGRLSVADGSASSSTRRAHSGSIFP